MFIGGTPDAFREYAQMSHRSSPSPAASAPSATAIPFFTLATGCASLALGLLVLIGWRTHNLFWVQVSPTLAPMQYNSALSMIFLGAAIITLRWDRSEWASPYLGALAAALGGLSLIQDIFPVNLGIDGLFFHSYVTTGTPIPGRMSPVTALCTLLMGLALAALGRRHTGSWRLLVAGSLASLTVSIALVPLLGYAFGIRTAYAWGHLTDVAIQSAGVLLLLGAGLFRLAWKTGTAPGERTPRWLPVPLMLGVLSTSIIFYGALNAEQNVEISQTVKAGVESVKSQIGVRLDARTRSIVRMALRWEAAGGTPQAAWENDAANYIHDFPDLQALEWIDASHHVRWIVPLAGNEAKVGRDLTQEAHRKAAVAEAELEHQPVITPIVPLFRGGAGFVIYVPLRVNGQSDGFIAAILNAKTCLDRFLHTEVAAGEALEFSDGGKVFYTRDAGNASLDTAWIAEDKVEMHGASWTFRIWPTAELATHLCSPLPLVILIAGALGSLLLGATCFFAQRSSRLASETARKNGALEAALDKVRTLEGLLPICSCCKRVRDDTGYWNQIDTYIGQHTNASLSHGYCPECAAKTFKDFGFDIPESVATALEAGNFERSRLPERFDKIA